MLQTCQVILEPTTTAGHPHRSPLHCVLLQDARSAV